MRRIMLAMSPERAKLALEGRLKDAILKTFPKCDLPCEVLICVTNGEDILIAYEDYDYDSMGYYGPEYAIMTKNLFARKPSKDDEDYSLYESNRDAYDYYKNDFDKDRHDHEWKLNGKVVAKFTLNRIERVEVEGAICGQHSVYREPGGASDYVDEWENSFQERTCVTADELEEYVGRDYDMHVCLWHIDGLKIFDEPKELGDFEKEGGSDNPTVRCPKKGKGKCNEGYGIRGYIGCEKARLKRPPQSWQYVEEI